MDKSSLFGGLDIVLLEDRKADNMLSAFSAYGDLRQQSKGKEIALLYTGLSDGKSQVNYDYGGWFTNLFSKEGRIENKKVRADKKEKRAKAAAAAGKTQKAARLTKSANRLNQKAGTMETKLSGESFIEPAISNAAKLWEVRYPWKLRQPQSRLKRLQKGKALLNTALGWQPTPTLASVETRATIYGGIEALQLAGIVPWTNIKLDITAVTTKKANIDFLFLEWVKSAVAYKLAAGQKTGAAPKTIRQAAQYMRVEVNNNDLQEAAWGSRALAILGISGDKLAQTGKLASAGGAMLGMAGMMVAALPIPPISQVVGAGMAIVGGALSAGGASSSAKSEETSIYIEDFTQLRAQAFQKRYAASESIEAEKSAKIAELKAIAVKKIAFDLDLARQERVAKTNQVMLATVGLCMLTYTGVYLLNRRKTK